MDYIVISSSPMSSFHEISAGIVGVSGRMGSALVERCRHSNVPITLTANTEGWRVTRTPNVIVNISSNDSLEKVANYCITHKVPWLEGTSSLTARDVQYLDVASLHVPTLRIENFSAGHYIQGAIINKVFASINLEPSQKCVTDRHPISKKDAPSSTAKSLASIWEYHTSSPIEVQCTREGEPVSDHGLELVLDGKRVTVLHQVFDYSCLASGALRLARWTATQEAGLLWTGEQAYDVLLNPQ